MYKNRLIESVVSSVLNEVFNSKIASTCVYMFCRDRNGRWNTLIGRRGGTAPAGAYQYTPPMGLLEIGENPIDGAVREVHEETELKINKNLLREYDREEWAKGKVGINYCCVLSGVVNDYVPGAGDGENERFIWIPIIEHGDYPFAFGTDVKLLEIANKVLR